MDCEARPLDFALILHFQGSLDAEALRKGAASACNRFPSTGSVVDGKNWRRLDDPRIRIEEIADEATERSIERSLASFVNAPLRLTKDPPLCQMLAGIDSTGKTCLATRVHHCAADLLSCLFWLHHQLRVAAGADEPIREIVAFDHPRLADAPPDARRNPYWGRSDPLRARSAAASSERRWNTFSIPSGHFTSLSRERNGFTYNDVLVTALLETVHWWNTCTGEPARKVGIWLPINIRRQPFEGFGNGSSRIRVRRNYSDSASFREKCLAVRRQVDEARLSGEWVVPENPLASRLPLGIFGPALRAYLRRPWADTGSVSFTHLQHWPGKEDEVFGGLERVEVVGALHERHSLMLAAVTWSDRTWLTATYDPALLRRQDVDAISDHFRHRISSLALA